MQNSRNFSRWNYFFATRSPTYFFGSVINLVSSKLRVCVSLQTGITKSDFRWTSPSFPDKKNMKISKSKRFRCGSQRWWFFGRLGRFRRKIFMPGSTHTSKPKLSSIKKHMTIESQIWDSINYPQMLAHLLQGPSVLHTCVNQVLQRLVVVITAPEHLVYCSCPKKCVA